MEVRIPVSLIFLLVHFFFSATVGILDSDFLGSPGFVISELQDADVHVSHVTQRSPLRSTSEKNFISPCFTFAINGNTE